MPLKTTNLFVLADDLRDIFAELRESRAVDGPGGRKITPAELGRILLAAGKLVAHVGGMISA